MKIVILITLLLTSHFSHLKASHTELNQILQSSIERTNIPGVVAAVIKNGKLEAAGFAGVRKKGESQKITIHDKFHIGSLTKSMTATLAAVLIEKKIITWNSTIKQFLKIPIHQQFENATLIELLSHTAGVPSKIDNALWSTLWENNGSAQEQRLFLAKEMLNAPPQYPVGTDFEYSNAGYAIAGVMLEEASKQPWEELMEQNLFKPLNMKNAGFRAPPSTNKVEQPWGHSPAPVHPEPSGDNPRGIAPAGAVHCSILDLAKFVQFHLNRETGLVLNNKSSFQMLHKVRAPEYHYALGWIVTERKWAGGKALTHSGSNTMWYSTIWIAPQKNFAALVCLNSGGELASQTCDAIIGMLIKDYL